jgi:AraC-like DNA-binding protein
MSFGWVKEKAKTYNMVTNLSINVYDLEQNLLFYYGTQNNSFILFDSFLDKCIHSKSCYDTYNTSNEHFILLYINNLYGEFYVSVGSCSTDSLQHHVDYLTYLFDINYTVDEDVFTDPFNHPFFDKVKLEYREIDFYHHNYFVEKMFFHHTYNNRLTDADINSFINSEPGLVNKDYANNIKQLGTVVLTLAGRYSIEFGLDTHTSFTISDSYFRRIDESKTMKEITFLLQQALDEYTNALSITNENKYSKKINDAKIFIDHNLSMKFTQKDIADHVKLNPSYLSRQFKKEVGMNISDYILSEKIREAKIMLEFSNYSLQDISDILNFSSKSYFIRCFRKTEGLTPLSYRNKINHSTKTD